MDDKTRIALFDGPNALISVVNDDKPHAVESARRLHDLGWNILASGGTAREILKAGIPVIDVTLIVGGEAILGHRVVTLSRELHAGLLANDSEEQQEELDEYGIPRIDLVYNTLYKLSDAVKNAREEHGDDLSSILVAAIESTDVGGVTMRNSANKGLRIVACSRERMDRVLECLEGPEGQVDELTRLMLILDAYMHNREYYDPLMEVIEERILQLTREQEERH